uniref:Zinc knuckle CX2CX4HX4C n=1 Tax=Tanacetum cinerariifolium TaxID=118510 RepID=A0A6L2K064_TANCI|nr:zinc knuckle CX2CX4HX4C [Tanacetum cinerariifolium]
MPENNRLSQSPNKVTPGDLIVQSVDINTKSTSYAGAVGASTKDQPKVNSNFHSLVADPVFDGVTISIPHRVVEKTNDGFQTVGKKKRRGKSKSTNGGQFVVPLVKQNARYEPKVTISEPKKGATNVGNASKSSSMLKSAGTSSKKGNITTSNFYSALENEEDEDEEHVENVYDEPANLFPNSKTSESSSFTAAAG